MRFNDITVSVKHQAAPDVSEVSDMTTSITTDGEGSIEGIEKVCTNKSIIVVNPG
jgi:hypothetical protein